ncbi:putative defense protein 3 [Pelodytes ibericus]
MVSSVINIVPLLAAIFTPHVAGFPNGDVKVACVTMEPRHGVSAQTNAAPYNISVSKTNITGEETVIVTLSANPGAPGFKGFLIQARTGNNTDAIGFFKTNTPEAQTLDCATSASAVSHTSNSMKNSVQVMWVAPNQNISDLLFRGTVVQVRNIFWMDVRSLPLSLTYNGSYLLRSCTEWDSSLYCCNCSPPPPTSCACSRYDQEVVSVNGDLRWLEEAAGSQSGVYPVGSASASREPIMNK